MLVLFLLAAFKREFVIEHILQYLLCKLAVNRKPIIDIVSEHVTITNMAIISRTEAGREIPPSQAGVTQDFDGSASYIVPHYHPETGGLQRQGFAINKQAAEKMERIMMRYGEKIKPQPTSAPPEPDVKTTGRKRKAKQQQPPAPPKSNIPTVPYAYAEEEDVVITAPYKPKEIVSLVTKYGTIKGVVDAVLETDTGVGLVFANDDEVRFTPEAGQELSVILPNGQDVKVMYLGVLFRWYNTQQQIMMFIKSTTQEKE